MTSLDDTNAPAHSEATLTLADATVSLDNPALATIPYFATLKTTPCEQKMDVTQLQAVTKADLDTFLQARSGDIQTANAIVPSLTLANLFLDTVGAAAILAHPTTHLNVLALLEPLWVWRAQSTVFTDLPEWTALLEKAYQRLRLDVPTEIVQGWPINLWMALLEDTKLPAVTRLELALDRLKKEPTREMKLTDLIQSAFTSKHVKLPSLTERLIQLGRTEWLVAALAASTGVTNSTTWRAPEGYQVVDITAFDIQQLSFGEPVEKKVPNVQTRGGSGYYTAVDMLYAGEKQWLLRLPDGKIGWEQVNDTQNLGSLSYERKSPAWPVIKACLDGINGAIRRVVANIRPRGLDLDCYRVYNYREIGNYGYISLKRRPQTTHYDDLTGEPLKTLPMKWSTAKAPLIDSYLFCNQQHVSCSHYLHQTHVLTSQDPHKKSWLHVTIF